MKRKYIVLFAFIVFVVNNCLAQQKVENTNNEYLVQATLWYQQSAEMRALYYQTFNTAKMVLDDKLMKVRLAKPAAMVVDIDETMLDNSPFEVHSITTGESYTKKNWLYWTSLEEAKALPGAVDFMNHAQEKGVEVFYISNRYHEEMGTTIENLKKEGFPNADSMHLFLKTDKSDKTARRQKVSENYTILMLLGDNLADFSQEFANRGEDMGKNIVDEKKDLFGSTFFVLPNPMYGEWEKVIYGNSNTLTNEEKDKARKTFLKGYQNSKTKN